MEVGDRDLGLHVQAEFTGHGDEACAMLSRVRSHMEGLHHRDETTRRCGRTPHYASDRCPRTSSPPRHAQHWSR
uniref:Uncharacterized protein n=1 Tax=Arundo donax TaxID=35708 RepID=A0A0A8ZMN5_ARUDO